MARGTGPRALVCGLIAVMMWVLIAPAAWADGNKKDVPLATRLAAKSHPAVQLIVTKYSAELVVPTAAWREGALRSVFEKINIKALNGEIPKDELSRVKAAFDVMLKDVDSYVKSTGPDRVVKAETGGLCTGWWVTPDGYMVTAAHCVQPDQKEISDTFAKQALGDLAQKDVKSVQGILKGVPTDDELNKKTLQLLTTFNALHLKTRNLTQGTTVLQAQAGGGVDKTAKALTAEITSVGQSYPGKDVAVLKVSGQQNLPTLELGDEKDVQTGDTLYIDGFPGSVTNNDSLNLDTRLQPTFTQGPYNAQRATQAGVPYIQTQAPAYGGNSGGPVFDDSGRVTGILVAGAVDPSSGQANQNEQYVLPISVVKEKLNEKNVRPMISPTTVKFNKALDEFFKRHYKNALPEFRAVQALFAGHPYVAKYISDSQAAITAGKDETPTPITTWLIVGGGIAAVLVIGGLLVLILVRRPRRSASAGGGQPPVGAPYPGQPLFPQGMPQPGPVPGEYAGTPFGAQGGPPPPAPMAHGQGQQYPPRHGGEHHYPAEHQYPSERQYPSEPQYSADQQYPAAQQGGQGSWPGA